MFSNAGNIGIALFALVFSNAPYVTGGDTPYLAEAAAVSTLVLVQMNMFLNTLGMYQAGKGSLSPHDALMIVLHMPVIYTLVAAFFVKYTGFDISSTSLFPVLENMVPFLKISFLAASQPRILATAAARNPKQVMSRRETRNT